MWKFSKFVLIQTSSLRWVKPSRCRPRSSRSPKRRLPLTPSRCAALAIPTAPSSSSSSRAARSDTACASAAGSDDSSSTTVCPPFPPIAPPRGGRPILPAPREQAEECQAREAGPGASPPPREESSADLSHEGGRAPAPERLPADHHPRVRPQLRAPPGALLLRPSHANRDAPKSAALPLLQRYLRPPPWSDVSWDPVQQAVVESLSEDPPLLAIRLIFFRCSFLYWLLLFIHCIQCYCSLCNIPCLLSSVFPVNRSPTRECVLLFFHFVILSGDVELFFMPFLSAHRCLCFICSSLQVMV